LLEHGPAPFYHLRAVASHRPDTMMNATAQQILTLGEELIRTRGYSAFSFQDIADTVGIRKASIHYHFASKAELGLAVIRAYRETMAKVAQDALAQADDPEAALKTYIAPVIRLGQVAKDICTAGMLGSEHLALPETIRAEVAAFFREQIGFLGQVLERGRTVGAFAFPGSAEDMARLFLSTVEGGLMMKRALDEPAHFEAVLNTLLPLITTRPAAPA
jgi:TetR/AcrR family transcriptional regulator, transcriptional repressor for nem operon